MDWPDFVTGWIARLDGWLARESQGRFTNAAKREIYVLREVWHVAISREVALRAAALTYHALLAIVPLLAVGLALFKAFGGFEDLEGPLKTFIYNQLPVANADQLTRTIEGFIGNVNAGAVAGVGLLVLFYSAVGLMTNIEEAFNSIWGVTVKRPLYIRVALYWCLLTLAPPLLALSISISTNAVNATVATWFGPSAAGLVLALLGPVTIALLLFVAFAMVPETRVPVGDAAIAALVSAVLWNVAKAGFLWTSAESGKSNAIYGALSALPLLIVWTHVSWMVVLSGVAYTRARATCTGARDPRRKEAAAVVTPTATLLTRVTVEVWLRFRKGQSLTTTEIAAATGLGEAAVSQALDVLVRRDILESTAREGKQGPQYHLRQHLGDLSLAELSDLLVDPRARAAESLLTDSPTWRRVHSRLTLAEAARRNLLLETVDEAAAPETTSPSQTGLKPM
jgi:membrane protein